MYQVNPLLRIGPSSLEMSYIGKSRIFSAQKRNFAAKNLSNSTGAALIFRRKIK
jgi:hypothetical protein